MPDRTATSMTQAGLGRGDMGTMRQIIHVRE
ncbi:hypothetical protein FB570_111101 [Streptomyces sp. T12]|nr:hypothetical protein FB570_111101 [Streptomyces sp. T12]